MKKTYKERKKAIYDSFQGIREAKSRTISRVSALGQKMNIFRYALLIFIVPMIFFYNLFIYMVMGFCLHKRTAKVISVGMSVILFIATTLGINYSKAYGSDPSGIMYVTVTTPNLDGKIVHASLHNRENNKSIPIGYETDLICDGRSYEIPHCASSFNGYRSNNYVFTSDDPSVNINEQYSYITEAKTLDFTEVTNSTGKYYKIKGSRLSSETVIATVIRKSSYNVEYVTYDKFGEIPSESTSGSYIKTLTELGISGMNPQILAYTYVYYFNSLGSDCIGSVNFSVEGDSITNTYRAHGAPAGAYGWAISGVWIAYQQEDVSEKTDVYEIKHDETKTIYVHVGDELSITVRDDSGNIITDINEVIDDETEGELVVDDIVNVAATDKEYSGHAYDGLTISAGSNTQYTLKFTGRNDTVYNSETAPANTGEYTAVITAGNHDYTADFKITKAPLTITAKNQSVSAYDEISNDIDSVTVQGLKGTDFISSVELSKSTNTVTTNGVISIDSAEIKNGDEIRTGNYEINFIPGVLVVNAKTPVLIQPPVASDIVYGSTLNDSMLTGGQMEVSGTFEWEDASVRPQVSDSNSTEYIVIFTPDDSANYTEVIIPVKIKVLPFEITEDMITISDEGEYPFTGNVIIPDIIIVHNENVLTQNDYDLLNETHSTAYGKHTLTVKGKNNYCGAVDIEWKITDNILPYGTITVSENIWNEVKNDASFDIFYKNAQPVIIDAGDNESGIDTVLYYVSDEELSGAEISGIQDYKWTQIQNGKEFCIYPDSKCIVYAKLKDKEGNTAYISSDGIVLDGTAPVILGAEDGKKYCEAQTITVEDVNLEGVYINGNKIELDENGRYVLAEDEIVKKIVARDRAGNETVIEDVVVYDGHSFTHYVNNYDATPDKDGTETAFCDRGCGASDTRTIPDSRIKPGKLVIDCNIDENVPKTVINNFIETNLMSLLSEEEKNNIVYGSDYKFYINIQALDEIQSEEDSEKIQDYSQDFRIGTMLDISVYKQEIKNGQQMEPVKITDTEENSIKFTIDIPSDIINKNTNIDRTYDIVRIHDGVVEKLDSTPGIDGLTISFDSDKFSTYAIVFTDTENKENQEKPDDNEDVIAGYFYDPKYWLLAILAALGIVSDCFVIHKKRKGVIK